MFPQLNTLESGTVIVAVTHRLLLWCAATDRTFERMQMRGEAVFAGKCIHCNRVLVIREDGEPVSRATIEHIIPRVHGGTNDLENIAIACGHCNGTKGRKLDHRRWTDSDLQAMITALQTRRKSRWREVPEDWQMPPLPISAEKTDEDASKHREAHADNKELEQTSQTGKGRGRGRGKKT